MDILSTVYLHAVAISAGAVLVLHQILKLKFIPWGFFNRYPVPGLILLSAASSVVVVWRTAVNPQSWTDWVVLGGTITVSAALTYSVTFKNWAELRSTEGTGDTKG